MSYNMDYKLHAYNIYIYIITVRNTSTDFLDPFPEAHGDRCRRKLGLKTWDAKGAQMWRQLLELMARTEADYTILFRSLVFCQDWPRLGCHVKFKSHQITSLLTL